ncbi:putative bacteriophage--like protein [Caballeronia choica]|uniref:Bacteriophage--like protein n=1 Tax=Caballeronia choica TaxID=326476 RepID=A0A158L615_9BURK|nr:hypothetical protein [Caballeronia choica]SAL88330.1 putative bacteriophage--like protein [Caballeronia choica]
MTSISIREFARREGVSHTLVVRAVKTGRLAQLPNGLMDDRLVGSPWRMGSRGISPSKPTIDPQPPQPVSLPQPLPPEAPADPLQGASTAPPEPAAGSAGKGLAYGEALRVKENYLAFLRRLDYEQRSGSVVDMAQARSVVFELCREQRDIWLAWPARVAPLIAAELGIADLDGLVTALTVYVHRQLVELGEPDATDAFR